MRSFFRTRETGKDPASPFAASPNAAPSIRMQKSSFPSDPSAVSFGESSFTLIELMAATSVLSVVLLMMVGMQDQMSRAWSNSNRRTDATREARAALSGQGGEDADKV